jgi:hypothetical protein
MSEEKPGTDLIKVEPLLQQIETAVPKMIRGRDRAVFAMSQVTDILTDEQRAEVVELVGAGKNTYEAMQDLRKPITAETDKLKTLLMQYEKDVNDGVERLRKMIGAYDQKKLDEKREMEERARKLKEKENYKVELTTVMRQNLANMIIKRVEEVNSGSKKFFAETTLEDYAIRAKQFNSFQPGLKEEAYERCFAVTYKTSLINEEELKELVEKVKSEETFSLWKEKIVKELTPILNEWKGRLPQLKDDLTAAAAAKDEEEKKRIEDERKKREEEEENQRQRELEKLKEQQNQSIQNREEIEKLGNEFQEQMITQQAPETGPTNTIARFKDDKPLKALCEVVLHCMNHPKFPGVVKRNKEKAALVDDHGFPVYIDSVQWFLDFYAKHCKDKKVDGVELKDVSKVIVRR